MTVKPAPAACNHNHSHCFFQRLCLFGLLVILTGSVHADIQGRGTDDKDKKRGTPTDNIRRAIEIPTPKNTSIQVLRGQPTDIVLEATTSMRQPVEFRLSDMPKAGTLTELRPSSESGARAIVTYTASPGSASSDVFSFRVKHKDTPTSGSASVQITIIDPKPDLLFPREIDFGEAIVGETAVRTLALSNRGTGRFAGRLEIPPPWRLLQELPDVEVLPGAKIELRLAFTPTRPGPETFILRYPHLPGVQTKLAGLGGSPIDVHPSLIQLEWDDASRSRKAEVTLTNRTGSAVDYTITTSQRLQFPDERGHLPAHESKKIPVVLPAGDGADLNTLFTVQSRGTRTEIPLTAHSAPAVIRVRETEHLQLTEGTYMLSEKEEAAMVLENAGGTTGTLFIKLPEGWILPSYEDGKELAPGDVQRVVLRPPAGPRGPAAGAMEIRIADQTLSLSLHAPAPPAPVSTAESKPDALLSRQNRNVAMHVDADGIVSHSYSPDEKQLLFMTDILGIYPSGTTFDRNLPEIPGANRSEVKKDRVSFSWENLGNDLGYIVFREEYRMNPTTQRPTRYWVPWENLSFSVKGNEASVTLNKLTPGRKYIIRLAVQAKDGRVGPVSVPVLFYTPFPKPFPWGWLATVGLLGGGGWWWHRRRKAEYE